VVSEEEEVSERRRRRRRRSLRGGGGLRGTEGVTTYALATCGSCDLYR
jgi:hypothetical protein